MRMDRLFRKLALLKASFRDGNPPVFVGKVVGLALGVLGGWFAAIAGLVIGALVDQLLERMRYLRAVEAFLRDPGGKRPPERHEGDTALAGLASWLCPGGMSQQQSGVLREGLLRSASPDEGELRSVRQLVDVVGDLSALANGPALAESLRDRPHVELVDAFRLLVSVMAPGLTGAAVPATAHEAAALQEIGAALGLSRQEVAGALAVADPELKDAYRVLGLEPGTDETELKTVYRRLAADFHPDLGNALSVEQQAQSREAFMKVDKAYRKVLASLMRVRG